MEHEALVSIRVEGISELLDPASNLLVATTITHFFSDEISQIEGVPVFFLKTEIYAQSRLADAKNRDVVLVKAGVHAVAVGGSIDDTAFTDQVQLKLNEKIEDLKDDLQSALDAFGGRLAGSDTDSVVNLGGGSSKSNTVILVAVVASVMIVMLVLSIGCIAMARKEKEDARELILKHSGSSFTAVHSRPSTMSHVSMTDGSRQIIIRQSSSSRSGSLPRPYETSSHHRKGSSRSNSVQKQQDLQSHYSKRSQIRSLTPPRNGDEAYYSRTDSHSHNRNLPPRPPPAATHYSRSGRVLSDLELSSSESISPVSSSDIDMMLAPPSADNIELVEIEDNEGSWTGTKVAAITGGRESVQKVRLVVLLWLRLFSRESAVAYFCFFFSAG